jgi:hypothetical protein
VPLAEHAGPERSAGTPCWACRGLAGADRAALDERAFGKWRPEGVDASQSVAQ